MAAKAEGNEVIPDAPVPSIVRMSMVPKPPDPTPKIVDGKGVEVVELVEDKDEISAVESIDEDVKAKGTIVVEVFENKPYKVEFSGVITGVEIDHAWRAMMKGYRVWKHSLIKKDTEVNGGV